MKGFSALSIAIAGLMLAVGTAGVSMSGGRDQSQVYTVAQIVAHQAHDPRAWANRRVLVRAIGGGCIPWVAPTDSPCIDEGPELVEVRAGTLVAVLPVVC